MKKKTQTQQIQENSSWRKTGRIVVMAARVHDFDLDVDGQMLKTEGQWEELNLPTEYEPTEYEPTDEGK
jgi:hypothetical protein